MLEKPTFEDHKIIDCIQAEYGPSINKIAFLPLGADLNTAVYRAVSLEGTAYFVKLRRGDFDKASVGVPKFLSDQGIQQVIPPLSTRTGKLWASLPPYSVILFPFVGGKNGFEVDLTSQQWVEFGRALHSFHSAVIPPEITGDIQQDKFSPLWRDSVMLFMQRIEAETYAEPVAADMAAYLHSKSAEVLELVDRAERCARAIQDKKLEFILCHGDIHAWNLLIVDDRTFYMVDWDTLIFAPRERDLMFIGGGLGGRGRTPQEEESLFYQGYGQAVIDPVVMAYYRYERIIEDIAVTCEQIFQSDEGGEDRPQFFGYLKSNFVPGGMIDIACQTDRTGWFSANITRPADGGQQA